MTGLLSLVRRTTPSSFAYIAEKMGNSLTDKVIYGGQMIFSFILNTMCDVWFPSFCTLQVQMDELACFAPGMIALGASGYGPDKSQQFLTLAEEVKMNILSLLEREMNLFLYAKNLQFLYCFYLFSV